MVMWIRRVFNLRTRREGEIHYKRRQPARKNMVFVKYDGDSTFKITQLRVLTAIPDYD